MGHRYAALAAVCWAVAAASGCAARGAGTLPPVPERKMPTTEVAREAMPLGRLLPEWERRLRRLLGGLSDDGRLNGRAYGRNLFDFQVILPAVLMYALDHPENKCRGDEWLAGRIDVLAKAIDERTAPNGRVVWSVRGREIRLIDQRLCIMLALAAEMLERAGGRDETVRRLDGVARRVSAELVREKLEPAKDLERLDTGTFGTGTNHFVLYAAAVLLTARRQKIPEWEDLALDTFRRLTANFHPGGYFEEHRAHEERVVGPTISYNALSLCGEAVYYCVTGDPRARACLDRGLEFTSSFTVPGLRCDSNLDERVNSNGGVSSWMVLPAFVTPGWRRYGTAVLEKRFLSRRGRSGGEDLATAVLPLCLGAVRDSEREIGYFEDSYSHRLGELPAGVVRRKPWYVSINALPDVTWRGKFKDNGFALDRTSVVTLHHDSVGLIVDGANTKSDPDGHAFVPAGDGEGHHHSAGEIDLEKLSAELAFPGFTGRVQVRIEGEKRCVLRLSAVGDAEVTANVMLAARQGSALTVDGGAGRKTAGERFALEGVKGFSYRGYRATVSRGAELVWPIEYHNPYGRSGARGWRLRLSVPVTPEGVEIAFEIE